MLNLERHAESHEKLMTDSTYSDIYTRGWEITTKQPTIQRSLLVNK
jgi:hypothetical protein